MEVVSSSILLATNQDASSVHCMIPNTGAQAVGASCALEQKHNSFDGGERLLACEQIISLEPETPQQQTMTTYTQDVI